MAALYGRAQGSRLSQTWRNATERFRKRPGGLFVRGVWSRLVFVSSFAKSETSTLEREILVFSTSSVWCAKHLTAQGMARNTRWAMHQDTEGTSVTTIPTYSGSLLSLDKPNARGCEVQLKV